MKRILVCLIAIMLLLSVFLTSCNTKGQDGNKESDTASDVVEESYEDELGFGKQDNGGREFKILLNNVYPIFERDFYVEAVDGNNLNRVVYTRNVACEQYLGVTLKYICEPGDWKSGISAKVANLILGGGTCDYDMMAVAVNAGLNGGNIGIYQNIMEMEYIDFEHSWWIQDMIDQNSINGQLYFLAGDACMTTYSSMGCVFANLSVADKYKIGVDLYQLVKSGNWTVEQLFTLFKNVKDDGGDGTIDPLTDTYGWCDHGVGTRLMWSSCDISMLERQSDDTFVLIEELDARILKFVSDMKDACDSELSYHTEKDAEMADAFTSNRILFATTQLARIEDIKARNMEGSFAVLPLPKYDESQLDYISTAMANHNALFFPITIASPVLSAQVAEFMGWYGQSKVIPEYYDVNLKYKQNDDAANLEMLDLIREKLRVTPNETYGAVAGGKSVMTMTQTTATNTSETGFYSKPVSKWEENVSALSDEIRAYIFKYYQ